MTTNERNALRYIDTYDRSSLYSLDDCYTNFSAAKQRAWNWCINRMLELDGWGMKILTYNTNMFTCGFLYEDKATGVIRFVVETPKHEYECDY